MAIVNTTTKDEFEKEVLKSQQPVLVDFWAAWCGPCRAMTPALENISNKMADELKIVKVNIEESADNGALAQEYEVQGIPNMQLFKDGDVIKTLIGAHPESLLVEEIQKELS